MYISIYWFMLLLHRGLKMRSVYLWFQNGHKNLPKQNPVIQKTYFINVSINGTSNKFRRHDYSVICENATISNQVPIAS